MKKIFFAILAIFMLGFAGCMAVVDGNNGTDNSSVISDLKSDDFVKIESKAQLQEYLIKNTAENFVFSGFRGGFEAKSLSADSVAQESGTSGSGDYTTTNVQEKGVDEADLVKTDGDYIYVLGNNNLIIYDAKSPENTKEILIKEFDGNYEELFITKNKVILLGNAREEVWRVDGYNFVPRKSFEYSTSVLVYEFDGENIEIEKNYSLTGNYYDSRLIGDDLYFVSQEYVYGLWEGPMPLLKAGDVEIESEFYILPNPQGSYVTYSIAGVSLDDLEDADVQSFMAGYDTTFYVSENNIYFASKKPWSYHNNFEQRVERFEEAVLPLLDLKTQMKIEDLRKDEDTYFEDVAKIMQEMYGELSEKEAENLAEEIEESLDEYDVKMAKEKDKTDIFKLSLDGGKVELEEKGEVRGSLLNQFSLSEYDGNLRVATTSSFWSNENGREQSNNVYVLDESLEVIGSLEDLAEDERIYSARFEADKLYLVTFKQVDPFFVIDLEDPTNPEVLGYLKLPGFSKYLHKISEDVVIGIGQDTKESEWGGVVTNGLKFTLFDVSDFENPKELDSYYVEGRYSNSEVLNEHKAFFYDESRSLLAIPVSKSRDLDEKYYRAEYWQGVLVFDLENNEFDLLKEIEHSEWGDRNRWNSGVRRVLRIDEVMFTVSNTEMILTDLGDFNQIEEFEFPESEQYVEPYSGSKEIMIE